MKLPKVYQPGLYESEMYSLWEKQEAFKPLSDRGGEGEPYAIVMPPPNANANLHIGYGLTAALEDIPIRYHRLRGRNALLLPGADHAGFETQVVYEKKLAAEGKSRFDFKREELYKQIWDFVAANRGGFEQQLRRLGVSCDWHRMTFTLDDKVVKTVYGTFKKMWEEGLIYRGERLVNFCTFHGTAFADIEVVYKEEEGKLWYLRYPLTDGTGEVVVATTRPETMLGDTAVAVHPEDARYHVFHGKTVRLPLTNREIPIVTDDFVDREYGTGAVKITPAHDPNDFEVAQRHNLPKITVIDHEGRITHEATADYHGQTAEEARERIVRDLEAQGALLKTEDLTHKVGHCYKCDNVIQPLLREQWFVDMKPLAAKAIETLEAGKIKFFPTAKRDQLVVYLKGLRDWNISRQIAWGIPIPAFQNVDEPDDWIYDEHVAEELIEVDGKRYRRDPDVFDTWFSSSSWPYSTLNFGQENDADFKTFYPLALMETGGEILYPWVSRMIMLGLYNTGEIPFKAVYIHGYVMAEDGSKMSKSTGNVVDPMPVIDEHGSDALRMGIIAGRSPAVNRGYDPRKVLDARNFCNKLWNVARYVEFILGEGDNKVVVGSKNNARPKSTADHWMLSRLQQSRDEIASHLDNYRFAEAYDTLYHFVWDDFADWYIEASKNEPNRELLVQSLESILKIAHPFAPFLTETIWQTLDWDGGTLLIKQHWPEVPAFDQKEVDDFNEIKAIVTESRFIIRTLGVSEVNLYYKDVPMLAHNAELIKRLSGVGNVSEVTDGTGVFLTSTKYRCWLDIDRSRAEAYREQLAEKRKDVEGQISRLKGRLDNESYVKSAPPAIVEQTRAQLTDAQHLLENIDQESERFNLKP